MSVSRAVNMSFVAAGLLLWLIAGDLFAFALGLFGPNLDQGLIGVGFTVSDLLGILAGIGGAVVLYKHEVVNTLAHEIANELSKVTWPTWPETRASTFVVVVVTIICALGLGFFDMIWSILTELVYK